MDTDTAARRLEGGSRDSNRRRRRVTLALAGIAVAGVLGVLVWNGQSADPPAPADHGNDAVTSGAPYLLDLATGGQTPLPEALVVEPELDVSYSRDATMAAAACPLWTCEGQSMLAIAHADGTVSEIPVPEGSRTETQAWSGDGTRLLYRLVEGSRDLGDLFVYDLDEAISTRLTDLGMESVYWVDLRADFTADGETVLFHRPRDGTSAARLDVWTVPVTGGDPRRVLRDAAQPEALSTSGRIAFVQPDTNPLTGRVVASVGVGTGRPPQTLFEMPSGIVDFQLSPDGTHALVGTDEQWHLVDIGTGEMAAAPADAEQWVGNDTLLITPEQEG